MNTKPKSLPATLIILALALLLTSGCPNNNIPITQPPRTNQTKPATTSSALLDYSLPSDLAQSLDPKLAAALNEKNPKFTPPANMNQIVVDRINDANNKAKKNTPGDDATNLSELSSNTIADFLILDHHLNPERDTAKIVEDILSLPDNIMFEVYNPQFYADFSESFIAAWHEFGDEKYHSRFVGRVPECPKKNLPRLHIGFAKACLLRLVENDENSMNTTAAILDNQWLTYYESDKDRLKLTTKAFDKFSTFEGEHPYFLDILLNAYQASGDIKYLKHAADLAVLAVDYFYGNNSEKYGPLGKGSPEILRSKAELEKLGRKYLLAESLNRLSWYTGDEKYRALAIGILNENKATWNKKSLTEAAAYAHAAMLVEKHPLQMVVLGAKTDPRAAALLRAANRMYEPRKVVFALDPADPTDKARLAKLPYQPTPEPTLFACVETACAMPITDPAQIAPRMKKFVERFMDNKLGKNALN